MRRLSVIAATIALCTAFPAAATLAGKASPPASPTPAAASAAPAPTQAAPPKAPAPAPVVAPSNSGADATEMTEDEAAPPAEPDETVVTPLAREPESRAHRAAPEAPARPAREPEEADPSGAEPARTEHVEHVVLAHETLGGIAHHYRIHTAALAAANGITRTTPIRVGQHLVIPAPGETIRVPSRVHVVGKGNTLGEIARVYGVSIEAILRANHLERRAVLRLEQRLIIPGTSGMPVPSIQPESEKAERSASASDNGIQELPIPGTAPAYYYEPLGPRHAKMRPVIVYLHGRGAVPKRYCERWARVARNLGWLVCPSGPEDRGDGKRGWNNSWPVGRNIVMAAIEGLRKRYGRRVQLYGNTLIGFSEGAFVAMNVGLREPHTFNRWLILGADADYWGAAGLATLPEARGRVRRVYLITGGHDDVVGDAARVRHWLTEAGVPVRVSTPRDMGHEVALDTKAGMYRAALRWLAAG